MLTRADKGLIIILIIIAMCGIIPSLLFTPSQQKMAEIRVDGNLVRTIELRQGYTEKIRIGGQQHFNEIEIYDQKIRIIDADCPDKLCIKTGWISLPSQQIVCLPWHVVVKIVPTKSQNIDGIAR